jgi:FMN phosphatase YigB (HAD superfamily)
MVGDTLEADILGANNIGMISIWITRRVKTADSADTQKTNKPDYKIAALADLPSLISRIK